MTAVGLALAALGAWWVRSLPGLVAVTGAFLLVATLADRLLAGRASAGARSWLYVGAFARLALPIGFATPFGLWGGGGGATAVFVEGELALGAPGLTARAAAAPEDALLGGVYLLVAAALFARWLLGRRALGRIVAATRPAYEAVRRLAPGCAVRVHPTQGPLVAGLWRAVIVLPERLVASAGEEAGRGALACVLAHERAHVARRDHLRAAFVQLVCIAAWPVLPLWLAARRLRTLMEMAADERALRARDGQGPGVRAYGEALVAIATGDPPARAHALAPSFGADLRARLVALRARPRWRRGAQAAAVIGAAALALACSTERSDEAPRAAEESAPVAQARVADPELVITDDGGLFLDGRRVTEESLVEELRPRLEETGRGTVLLRISETDKWRVVKIMSLTHEAGARRYAMLQALPVADVIPGLAQGPKGLDKDVVRKVVRRHIGEVKSCLEQELAARPDLGGRILVRFTVGGDGRVQAATIDESTLGSPAVETCVSAAVRTWEFPKPADGRPVEIAYPFSFMGKPVGDGAPKSSAGPGAPVAP
jgi:TonB family protein